MLYSMLTGAPAGESTWGSTLMLVAMLVAVYAMLIIPQRKRTKKEEQMRNSIEIGDEVITIGGIVGLVVSIKDDTIVIESGSDRMRLRVLRGAISRNVTAEENEREAKAASASAKGKK